MKRPSSNRLRDFVPHKLTTAPANNTIGKALPLLTGVLLLGTTCCGYVFLKSQRLTAASGQVEGTNAVTGIRPAYLTVLASSALQEASYVAQTNRQPSRSGRTFSTEADTYYQKFKTLPIPPVVHDNLDRMLAEESRRGVENFRNISENSKRSNKILIIGDVHGCLDELKALVAKASKDHNGGEQFASVVFVGDLCNKGPYSSQVVRLVREQPYWYTIRGNHDNAALEAALGDTDRLGREQYSWVKELSDEDVEWIANLPYSIRIPMNKIKSPSWSGGDVLVVHAGLIPNVDIDEQNVKTMVTVRALTSIYKNDTTGDSSNNASLSYEHYNPSQTDTTPIPWAKAWTGPELVIFGHDAKRGTQIETHAIGLDSGCVYGNKLTGIVLPEMEFVSVDAAIVYCPIKHKD
eukprot:CCRYP_005675-RA/>CCRYP_005675-RA protein AED:0.11 eAED:0.11 QI:0/-1/0/1/-1/1/1/0/406